MDDLADLVLREKRDPEQEYVIHLFEHCNLRCSFCWQGQSSRQGLTQIREKIVVMDRLLKDEPQEQVVVNIMGGEVFAPDILTPTLLEDYKALVTGLGESAQRHGKQLQLNWLSNLVTDKHAEIEALLTHATNVGVDSALSTSYDPRGRFTREQFAIFKDNVARYQTQLKGISVVLSRSNLRYLLSGKDRYFDKLYATGIPIYFDYHMPDRLAADTPSDREIYEFFCYLIAHYPKTTPVAQWLTKRPSYLTCRSTKMVLEDGSVGRCGILIRPEVAAMIFHTPIAADNNRVIENAWLDKHQCLSCEYFSRCSLGCFMNDSYRFKEEMGECPFKAIHRHIDQLPATDCSLRSAGNGFDHQTDGKV